MFDRVHTCFSETARHERVECLFGAISESRLKKVLECMYEMEIANVLLCDSLYLNRFGDNGSCNPVMERVIAADGLCKPFKKPCFGIPQLS